MAAAATTTIARRTAIATVGKCAVRRCVSLDGHSEHTQILKLIHDAFLSPGRDEDAEYSHLPGS